jgi:chromosome segregation ATPase
MGESANVSSVDAVDSFRVSVINYLAKTRPLLEDVTDDVRRTRQWLEHDRRTYWENQIKRRRKALEEAEQAVFSARISDLRAVSSAENAAVARAKRAMNEAEEKLRAVKRWTREFDLRVEPLVKQLEQLGTTLSNTMPKAAVHLGQLVKTLDAYAATNTAAPPAPPTAPADAEEKP